MESNKSKVFGFIISILSYCAFFMGLDIVLDSVISLFTGHNDYDFVQSAFCGLTFGLTVSVLNIWKRNYNKRTHTPHGNKFVELFTYIIAGIVVFAAFFAINTPILLLALVVGQALAGVKAVIIAALLAAFYIPIKMSIERSAITIKPPVGR